MFKGFKSLNLDEEKFFYSISTIIPKVLSILIIPLLLRLITPSNWGIVSLLLVLQQIFLILFNHGLSMNLFKNYDKENLSKNVLFRVFIEVSLFFSVTYFIIYYFNISELLNLKFNPLSWMLIATYIQTLNELLRVVSRIFEKPKQFLTMVILERIFTVGVQFLLVFREVLVVGYNSSGIPSVFFIGSFLGSIFTTLLFSYFFYTLIKNINSQNTFLRGNELLITLTITNLSMFLIAWFDRFVILNYLDYKALGIYSAYDSLARILRIAVEGFLFLYTAKAFSDISEKKLHELSQQIIKLGFNFLILGILITNLFINIILIQDYVSYSKIIFPLALSYFLLIYVSIFQNHLVKGEKFKSLMFTAISACCLNIILNYVLVPQFGIQGSAFGTLVSAFVISVSYVYISGYYKKLEFLEYLYSVIVIILLYLTFPISHVAITIIKVILLIYFLYSTILHVKKIIIVT